MLDRFKPISLCNTSYKILSKILATRVKSIMGRLISDSQGVFVAGRQILDKIIIVQESIHSSMENKQQCMAIKLYVANAFDRVNHFFLFEIMSKFGFSKRKKMIYSIKCIFHVQFNSHTLLLSFHVGVYRFLNDNNIVKYQAPHYKTYLRI